MRPAVGGNLRTDFRSAPNQSRAAVYFLLSFALVAASVPSLAISQAYPSKSVRIIVATGAGGSDDFHGRLMAQNFSEAYGQQFIVENRPGAGGLIGQTAAARALADGYTLLLGGGSMTAARYFNANYNLDVLRDFLPISSVVVVQAVMVVHPAMPVRNVNEFIALARTRAGKLTFASLGTGQMPYLCAVLFNSMTNLHAVAVSYKEVSPMWVDLLAGNVDYSFGSMATGLAHIRGGKLHALAVTGHTRSPVLPEVPTISETALPSSELTSWLSILAPAGTPRAIIDSLNQAAVKIIAMPDVRERLVRVGSEPTSSTPEELAKRMADGVQKFGQIAKLAGVTPQ